MLGILRSRLKLLIFSISGPHKVFLHQKRRLRESIAHLVLSVGSVKHILNLVANCVVVLKHVLPLGKWEIGE